MSRTSPIEVTVSRVVNAPAETVYDLVSDVTSMGDYSPENTGAVWIGPAAEPEVGARFRGTNRLKWLSWSTKPTVTTAQRGRRFAFEVPGRSGAVWTYDFEPVPEGVRVTESMRQEHPTPLPIRFLQRCAGVDDRAEHLRAGMTVTLDRLGAAAERLGAPK